MTWKIVLTEDDPSLQELYVRALRKIGAEVQAFDNGSDALHALETTHPDLLITDINLPGISGVDLVKHARLRLKLESLKIIAISANYVAVRNPALRPLVDEVMEKPVNHRELAATCLKLLIPEDMQPVPERITMPS